MPLHHRSRHNKESSQAGAEARIIIADNAVIQTRL